MKEREKVIGLELIPISSLTDDERRLYACWQVLEDEDYLVLLVASLRTRKAIAATETVAHVELLLVQEREAV
jgi:hypothetical protein